MEDFNLGLYTYLDDVMDGIPALKAGDLISRPAPGESFSL